MADAEEQKSKGYGGKRPLWQWVVIYVIIGAVIYGVIYYFAAGDKSGYTTTPTNETYNNTPTSNVTGELPPTVESPTPSSPSASQEITVEGSEFAFSPANITVKQGQTAAITFKNTGKYPHNFAIAVLNVQTKTIQQGEEDTVTFTPNETGSFTIICNVPGHADRGMKGTLTVE